MVKDVDARLEGRHVIIVEDIVDTGLTLTYLQDILRARAPKSLKTACLLSKPSRRQGRCHGRLRGLYHRRSLRGGLRARLRGEVSQPRSHRGAGRRMKRFEIITEADARMLEIGSTVELAPGGIVTPLARDTLAARRVTVVADRHDRSAAAARSRAGGGCSPRRHRQRSQRRRAQARARPALARPRHGGHRRRHRRPRPGRLS